MNDLSKRIFVGVGLYVAILPVGKDEEEKSDEVSKE